MKFTTVSHACLYIEHGDIRLLVDPWVCGSCYWRSWWNYPEVSNELIESLNPTHIYITHLHWDHYHGPSLRRFHDINPKILLPKHFNKRMKNDIFKDFKFNNVKELDHGRKYFLENDFQIVSYQFNPFIIDSVLAVEADDITLLNFNDSKTFGFSLGQIIKNHPNVDFVFRSHSSATPIPQCIKGIDIEKTDRTPEDYANDFIALAKATKTKYAIPFASSHIYLHPLAKKFNKYYSNPSFVKKRFDSKINYKQDCFVMVSNSSWSKESGFKIKNHDFSRLESDIFEYSKKASSKLERLFQIENKQLLNEKAFKNYFIKFLKATSFPIKLLNFKFGFLINEKRSLTDYLCIVDGNKLNTKIIKLKSKNEIYNHELDFIIKTPIYVFNDCNVKYMHNTFTPSKLLEVIIASKKGQKKLSRYLQLVDLYENDCLPLYRLINLRNIIIIFRRFRELFDILFYFYKVRIRKKKIYQLYSEL